ncbi:DUF982 domain-containing protein [Hoeflea sp. YIM 152468]|uniref:DUF982 domain-containing protein n=1 Tax=Hoeflea sp. YIM 152468 TaxID=3031759 RepID=UPI0023DA0E80|nr:DUF982 domain-containing protein [Hoeflea sp. YIM 152468]MDF1610053.1 DUF982 domain-containing protein [Hoeflea sp. YIM 152468]
MRSTAWDIPITIDDPDTGLHRTVRTARHAQAVLQQNWPDRHGSRYRDAERACEKVIHGDAAPRTARQAFIAAAIEAHLHLS